MSVQALSWVFAYSEMTGVSRCVLMVIANRLGDHDGDEYCWPSIDRIAREARCSVRGAQAALVKAFAAGELTVDRAAGPHGTNIYRMPCRVPQARDAESAPLQNAGADLHPNRKEPGVSSLVTTSSSVPHLPRERDLIGDALARAEMSDPLEVPASRMRTLCVKANELRKLDPDVTPEEVARRAANWGSHFDGASISGPAIVTHWARLAHVGSGRPGGSGAARTHGYAEQLRERGQ